MNRWFQQAAGLLIFCSALAGAAPVLTDSSREAGYQVEMIQDGFRLPWAFEFVDQDTLIFSERDGRIGVYSRAEDKTRYLPGLPEIYFEGQGGLLDLKPSPEFEKAPWIYVTYSAYPQTSRNRDDRRPVTVLGRFLLLGEGFNQYRIAQWQVLLETESATSTNYHFGSRIAFDSDKNLYFSIGDRGARSNGQDRATHAGSILRVSLTGKPVKGNPYVGQPAFLSEIWSYGHRNPQGLTFDNSRRRMWAIEHGPRGGDELNVIEPGNNYGWPVVSQGKEYWGPVSIGVEHKDGMVDPVRVYIPSIAPSSLMLYTGEAFPEWQGDLFAGALVKQHLNHIHLSEEGAIIGETRMLTSLNERIRDVTQSPEGWIYFATDSGKLYQISPLSE